MYKPSLAGQLIASEKGFDTRQNTQILEHLYQKLIEGFSEIERIDIYKLSSEKSSRDIDGSLEKADDFNSNYIIRAGNNTTNNIL